MESEWFGAIIKLGVAVAKRLQYLLKIHLAADDVAAAAIVNSLFG